mgnify:CR=1 FL=1
MVSRESELQVAPPFEDRDRILGAFFDSAPVLMSVLDRDGMRMFRAGRMSEVADV